ncbi:MAG: B12-binding domain-containing radical SAM protein, partial [Dehalococcoidia bacterium]|nr:B12-binding domain-containing radical SAM protein [Dehalococcoidia bacterium]
MNVLMLNPPFKGRFSRTSRSPAVTLGGTIYYPFWLAYATGVLEQSGFQVSLIDAPAQGLSVADVIEQVKNEPPQLIVVDTSTPSIYSDVKVAEQLKEKFPSSFVALVGTHPSALPEETLKLSERVDAVAVGEYDYTMRDLASCLEKKGDLRTVDGLVFRDGDEIVHNRPRALIENVDALPFVSEVYQRHLNIRDYYFAAANYPMVMIITGRGCPYKCFFCVYPQTFHSRKYRSRSAASVVDEFQWIVQNIPQVREIGIEDDTFT